ncbi:hypothetical protein A0H81_12773 [Grifola frondosa]|uniref:Uncharacterized protein n=1 Tax=Grifola frondosa TaxID=5627 RepID=A0A1C7LWC1_GRIFR|nr:hypothetical protein A0H81_12773 [Grifola frondosa]
MRTFLVGCSSVNRRLKGIACSIKAVLSRRDERRTFLLVTDHDGAHLCIAVEFARTPTVTWNILILFAYINDQPAIPRS